MAYTTIITIKDFSTTTPLWDGKEVKILATEPLTMDSENILQVKPKTFQDTSLITSDASSWVKNFNRRKANITYTSFNNHKFNITFIYNKDVIGHELNLLETISGTNYEIKRLILTPAKVMELILKPRTIYLKDDIIYPLLSTDEVTSTYNKQIGSEQYGYTGFTVPAIYASKGIPVLLTSWSFKPTGKPGEIVVNLTFTEDKDLTI